MSRRAGGPGPVAFSADAATVYAGCLAAAWRANDAACRLVALDAASGQVVAEHAPVEPVSQVVALASASGVAAVHATQRGCRIVGYDSELRVAMWSVTCAPGEMVTALAVDAASGWLIAGTNAGRVWLLHGPTGDRLAEYDLLYYSTVLSVAGMNLPAPDGVLVAGLANGQLAYLGRRKASMHHEDERERTKPGWLRLRRCSAVIAGRRPSRASRRSWPRPTMRLPRRGWWMRWSSRRPISSWPRPSAARQALAAHQFSGALAALNRRAGAAMRHPQVSRRD